MTYKKTIVCLANSRKMIGRCVAGKDITNDQWIRPVSERREGEISEQEQMFENGDHPQMLEMISIQFLEPCPKKYQTENHLIDKNSHWKKEGVKEWADLEQIKDTPSKLWLNEHSSSKGENDRIPIDSANKLDNSLFLIYVSEIQIHIKSYENKRQLRALFTYNEHKYNLAVTDLKAEYHFLKKNNGTYPIKNVYLCISLGEPLNDYCYKLVAGVITNPLF